MKNIERELRRMIRYEVPHAHIIYGNCVDDLRIIAPFDQKDTFFLKVEFLGGTMSIGRAKNFVNDGLYVERNDMVEIDLDL